MSTLKRSLVDSRAHIGQQHNLWVTYFDVRFARCQCFLSFRHSNHHLDVQHICFWLCLTKRYAAFLSLYLELMSHQNWLRSLAFTSSGYANCLNQHFAFLFDVSIEEQGNIEILIILSTIFRSSFHFSLAKNRNLDCSQFNQHISQRTIYFFLWSDVLRENKKTEMTIKSWNDFFLSFWF